MPSLVKILLQVRTKALVKLQAKSEEQAVTDRMPDAGLSKDVNADGYEGNFFFMSFLLSSISCRFIFQRHLIS